MCVALWQPLGCLLSLVFRIDPVLKDIEVVSGCNGNDVFRRVPGHVQNLFREVQTVHAHIATATPAPGVNAAGPQHGSWFAALAPRLEGHAATRLTIKHPEKTVIRSCHDYTWRGYDERQQSMMGNV